MSVDEAITMIEKNRDANPTKRKFVQACDMAITALRENKPLKNRCLVLSGASMCAFCRMKCPDLGGDQE